MIAHQTDLHTQLNYRRWTQRGGQATLAAMVMALAGCATQPAQQPEPTTPPPPPIATPAPSPTPSSVPVSAAKLQFQPVAWAQIEGWTQDAVVQAWPALLNNCKALGRLAEWKTVCDAATRLNPRDDTVARLFFESSFTAFRLTAGGFEEGMSTGYYEPILRGARKPTGPFQVPLHSTPPDILQLDLASVYPSTRDLRLRGRMQGNRVVPYYSREELATTGARSLMGREIVYIEDPIEAFFLQVQGSGRIRLVNSIEGATGEGETIRLAYAEQNGHPYKSIGRWLVDQGLMKLENASAQNIKAWAKANPSRLQELLNQNPSYVFFREEKIADPNEGPKGSLGVPLVAERSIAVDRSHVPLGAPMFVSMPHPGKAERLNRLTFAQDTGGAIRGPLRIDFYWGSGSQAGELAGKMRQPVQLWMLWPIGTPLPNGQ